MYDEDEHYSIWTVTPDGSRQNEIIEDPENWLCSPRWSARGDTVYYLKEQEPTIEIWKISISPDTGKPLKPPVLILQGQQVGDYFTLTKDGKNLAYTREIGSSNLWLASVEGSGKNQKVDLKPLTAGTMKTWGPSFSPDGKLIAYGRGRNTDTMNIFVMPAEGGPSQQITFLDSWNSGPVWSPDGKEIAFASNKGAALRIWKVSASGGTPQQFAKADGFWPAWAPGQKILFQTYARLNLMACDPATGEVSSLFKSDSSWQNLWPVWSPDSKRIAFIWEKEPQTGPGIWVLSLDGSSEVMLRKGSAIPIAWSKDGKWIYAWEPIGGGANVLAISPDNGLGEVLFTLPLSKEIGRPILRPDTIDGRRFVFEGSKSQSDVWVIENFDPEIK